MVVNRKITLFLQCLIDGLYPEVGEAVVAIFKRLKLDVDYPLDQTCCGQPAYNAGYLDEARLAARHFIETFEASEVIVCPSGSCVHMVRNHYPQLFQAHPHWWRRTQQLSAKTYELTEYLVDVLQVDDLGARYEGRVTYHDSCHLLRNLNISTQPRRLIKNISGARLVEMHNADYCCGFGGTFAVKYPRISAAMVADKAAHVLASGADVVTGCDMGCLMNIEGKLHRMGSTVKVRHIAELLAQQ
jgi:L-lactate dehydrogenase complex protein LldE